MKIKGFELTEYDEVEEDNVKIFHHVRVSYDGGQCGTHLNHTPYEHITEEAFRGYVRFYENHGRFPRYGEISGGNCTNDIIKDYGYQRIYN